MEQRIKVLVVDPALRLVRCYYAGRTRGADRRLIGTKGQPWYNVWPGHAMAVAERQQRNLPGWRLCVEACNQEVFHGKAVLYGVKAGERVSAEISPAELLNAIQWNVPNGQEEEPQAGTRRNRSGRGHDSGRPERPVPHHA